MNSDINNGEDEISKKETACVKIRVTYTKRNFEKGKMTGYLSSEQIQSSDYSIKCELNAV